METWEIEKIKMLIHHDEELKVLWEAHQEYEKKIEVLQSKRYLTPEEEVELKRLKREKLKGKDRIYEILRKYEKAGN